MKGGVAGDRRHGAAASDGWRATAEPSLESSSSNSQNRDRGHGSRKMARLGRCCCGSWWCDSCSRRKGWELRQAVLPVVRSFRSVRMLSLTLDRTTHASPRAGYHAMNEKISRLMQELKRRGRLHSGRYFAVLEPQRDGWPHWHVLIDAPDIPHAELIELWQRLGGGMCCWISRGPKPGQKFQSKEHAAFYATKYLIKPPRDGWPEWILEAGAEGDRIRRYNTSQHFFKGGQQRAAATVVEESEEAVLLAVDVDGEGLVIREQEVRKRKPCGKTYRIRVAECGGKTAVTVVRYEDLGGGEYRESRKFLGLVDMPRWEVLQLCGHDPELKGVVEFDVNDPSISWFMRDLETEWQRRRREEGPAAVPESSVLHRSD